MVDREDGRDAVQVGADIRVREQHTLRLASGAGGVDEAAGPIRIDIDRLRRVLAAIALERLEARHVFARQRHAEDVFQAVDLARPIACLFVDGVGRHEQHLGARVVDDVLPVFRQLGFIHRAEARAEAVGGVGGDRPFDSIARDDRHGVALGNTELRQTAAEIIDPLAELPVGDPIPLAVALGAEGVSVLMFGDRFRQNLVEVGIVGRLHRISVVCGFRARFHRGGCEPGRLWEA